MGTPVSFGSKTPAQTTELELPRIGKRKRTEEEKVPYLTAEKIAETLTPNVIAFDSPRAFEEKISFPQVHQQEELNNPNNAYSQALAYKIEISRFTSKKMKLQKIQEAEQFVRKALEDYPNDLDLLNLLHELIQLKIELDPDYLTNYFESLSFS